MHGDPGALFIWLILAVIFFMGCTE